MVWVWRSVTFSINIFNIETDQGNGFHMLLEVLTVHFRVGKAI